MLALVALVSFALSVVACDDFKENLSHTTYNKCISFTVGAGTGCEWMCSYCSEQLGTTNYYFTDGVCTYETGGCVGNPLAGKQYTCCSS